MAEMRAEARERRPAHDSEPALERRSNITALRESAPEVMRDPEASEAPPAPPRRRRLRVLLMLLGPAVLIAAALWLYLSGGRYVSTDNAYLRADKLSITAEVPGTVAQIAVHDNQAVTKGDVLFRLDDEPLRIALDGAEAQLGTVANEIQTLQATYRQNLSQIEQAKNDVTFFESSYERQKELAGRNVVSQAALDEAERNLANAKAKLATAQRQAEATLAELGGSADGKVEDHPRYREAQAKVDQARRDLANAVVTAPMDGIVTNVDSLQVGEYLPAAEPAFSLVGTDQVWVEANPKETDLTWLEPGDPAIVTVDAYPGLEWRARVASISPATGAVFSVLPAQNASGNWVKVVQRVPVRLDVDVPDGAPPLRAGMSVEATIDTGHERRLRDLATLAARWTGLDLEAAYDGLEKGIGDAAAAGRHWLERNGA